MIRLPSRVVALLLAVPAAAAPRVTFEADETVAVAERCTSVERAGRTGTLTFRDAACEDEFRRATWKLALPRLREQARALSAAARRVRVGDLLDAAARFAGVTWLDRSLRVFVVPGAGETTRAHPVGRSVVLEMAERADVADRYGVVVHELFHLLWGARSDARRAEIAGWFADAQLALQELEEALATVVGNVVAEEAAGGHPERDARWYDDEVVDGYARTLEPLVRECLGKGRTIDEAFTAEAKRRFAARFPDAERRVDVGLRRVVVIEDLAFQMVDADFARFASAARNFFRPREYVHAKLEAYAAAAPLPAIIVSRPDALDWLARFEDLRGACPRITAVARRAPVAYVARGASGRMHVVLLARTRDEAVALLDRVVATKVLPESGTIP